MPFPEEILWQHRLALFAMSLVVLAAVFELVRRGLLKERYALLWLGAAAGGLVIGVFPGIIATLASAFRLQYLTVIFLAYFVFTLFLVLVFSVVISRLVERNRALAQEVALLALSVKRLEERQRDE
jgi:hypothetical protein